MDLPGFPFTQELHEQHDALRATLHWLEAELAHAGCNEHEESFVLAPLLAFQQELGEHFRFEERHGFGGADRAPQAELRREARELAQEHRTFERRLAALANRIAALRGLGCLLAPDLAADLRDFCDQLRRHDAREQALLGRLAPPQPPASRTRSAPRRRKTPGRG